MCLFSAIYWSILEPSKSWIIKKFYAEQQHQLAHATLVSFGCGAVSGAIAAALTTPFDVAKNSPTAPPQQQFWSRGIEMSIHNVASIETNLERRSMEGVDERDDS